MEVINVTLNPNDMGSNNVLSNGNLTVENTNSTGIRATQSRKSGKWYWEMTLNSSSGQVQVGIANKLLLLSSANAASINQRTYYGSDGYRRPENIAYGTSWKTDEVLGVALDLDIGTLEFYKNGISMGISHSNIKELGEVYPLLNGVNSAVNKVTFNFGATPFRYPIPHGFYSYDGRQVEWYDKFLISSGGEIYSVVSKYEGIETATPKMTSDTVPSGRAFAKNMFNASYAPWYAFNRIDDAEGYASSSGSGGVGYLGYEFPTTISLYKYAIRSTDSSSLNKMPKDWTFEGSDDGNNWTVLDTQKNQTWVNGFTDKEYLLDKSFYYMKFKMYRLNWTANNGFQNYTDVNELKMFEIIAPKIVNIPATSESYFVTYGMNKGEIIDLASDVSSVGIINTSPSTLGSGKVFRQKIDTSKTPIKKASIT